MNVLDEIHKKYVEFLKDTPIAPTTILLSRSAWYLLLTDTMVEGVFTPTTEVSKVKILGLNVMLLSNEPLNNDEIVVKVGRIL